MHSISKDSSSAAVLQYLAQIFGENTRGQAVLCSIRSLDYTINVSEMDAYFKGADSRQWGYEMMKNTAAGSEHNSSLVASHNHLWFAK